MTLPLLIAPSPHQEAMVYVKEWTGMQNKDRNKIIK